MKFFCQIVFFALIAISALTICAQPLVREIDVPKATVIEIVNFSGRVDVIATPAEIDGEEAGQTKQIKGTITAESNVAVAESEVESESIRSRMIIKVKPATASKRIDLKLNVSERARLKIETRNGEIRVQGDFESVEAKTETGTIAADVPLDDLQYSFWWLASRPRYLADFELDNVKERSGGRFEIKGKYPVKADGASPENKPPPPETAESTTTSQFEPDNKKKEAERSKTIALKFTTDRGIVLLNVPPNEVSSDLRERPLTEAARAIIRSGDTLLMDAIRRASPKYFGDYTRTLPPVRREPYFARREPGPDNPVASVKAASVRVADLNNRAMAGLTASDFEVIENNEPREVLSARPITAPFNLVLLLDVSGSVDNYVNFIRKAARAFVNTVDWRDRVSIVLFNEDIKVLSNFTTDKTMLSKSLDSFDAGGGTAYYDALAYTLADTLRPMKGERTAIVVLTDGDDNRSFLAFDSLTGAIEESGALIYPLYVPSGLAAASANDDLNAAVDPLRSRYLNVSLTSKADGEGARLAKVSGGVYYPIRQVSQIQEAYDDIVTQLRTAYDVTFRSNTAEIAGNGVSPRLRIRVKKENAFATVTAVTKLP
jgi:VWFA-related protein